MKTILSLVAVLFAANAFAASPSVDQVRANLALAAERLSEMTQAQVEKDFSAAAAALRAEGQFSQAATIEKLVDANVREMVLARTNSLINETSQNGILLIADVLLHFGKTAMWLDRSCDDGALPTCIMYWVAVVLTLDSQEISVQ